MVDERAHRKNAEGRYYPRHRKGNRDLSLDKDQHYAPKAAEWRGSRADDRARRAEQVGGLRAVRNRLYFGSKTTGGLARFCAYAPRSCAPEVARSRRFAECGVKRRARSRTKGARAGRYLTLLDWRPWAARGSLSRARWRDGRRRHEFIEFQRCPQVRPVALGVFDHLFFDHLRQFVARR